MDDQVNPPDPQDQAPLDEPLDGSPDIEAADIKVRGIRKRRLNSKSANQYLRSSAAFLSWFLENPDAARWEQTSPSFITEELSDAYDARKAELAEMPQKKKEAALKQFLLDWLDRAPDNPPIRFDIFTPQLFFRWLVLLEVEKGQPSNATFNRHRSALRNLYQMYHQRQSVEFSDELSILFRGLKRDNADRKANGEGTVKEGKDPLDFGLYTHICELILKEGTKDAIFAHTFMVLAWNLMCRAMNVAEICWNHVAWHEDALQIYFAHTKTDQLGDRPKDARHLYANPVVPAICPVTALGVFLYFFLFFP